MPAGWAAAAAAVVGGVASASSASKAAKAQGKSTDAAIGEQQRQYDTTREDQYGYRKAGEWALNRLTGNQISGGMPRETEENFDAKAYLRDNPDVAADAFWGANPYAHYMEYGRRENREYEYTDLARKQMLAAKSGDTGGARGLIDEAMDPAEVMRDPGYQFGMQQGQQALDRKIAAMGGRVSGAALKAAARYGTDYASTGYNAAYQRGQDRLNRLASLAGLGQTATQSSAAAGASSTNAISNLLTSQGDANAARAIGQGNIWQNAGNQLSGYYMNQQRNQQPSYTPNTYGAGYGGGYVNQGPSGGDVGGSYWGVE